MSRELIISLQAIAGVVQGWPDWQATHQEPPNMSDASHLITLPVPHWPDRGTLGRWVSFLTEAAAALESARSQNTSLLERVKEMEEALRPFAEAAELFSDLQNDKALAGAWITTEEWQRPLLPRAGMFRRARSVLNNADPNLAQEGKA